MKNTIKKLKTICGKSHEKNWKVISDFVKARKLEGCSISWQPNCAIFHFKKSEISLYVSAETGLVEYKEK